MQYPTFTPVQMRNAMRCAALCDAALADEEWLRVFSFTEMWSDGVDMGHYDNGGGDHAFVFVLADGRGIIKGFDHESEVSPYARDDQSPWLGMYDGVPADLMALLQDAGVQHEDVTFCCWSEDGKTWQSGAAHIPADVDDGSGWMLDLLQMDAEAYSDWARDYFEEDFEQLGEAGVRDLFARRA